MSVRRDTICALASGPSPSAIAVIRISGPGTATIIENCLSVSQLKPRHASVVDITSSDGVLIDTGLATYMPGPASYTGEDTLELSVHGGRIITELTLTAIMSAGARLAEPGEFTRRAFEAGKLDLTRAEAVADLIDAETEAQHRQALKQMDGALEHLYSGWRNQLVEMLALLEASIDFPDEEDAPRPDASGLVPRRRAPRRKAEQHGHDRAVGDRQEHAPVEASHEPREDGIQRQRHDHRRDEQRVERRHPALDPERVADGPDEEVAAEDAEEHRRGEQHRGELAGPEIEERQQRTASARRRGVRALGGRCGGAQRWSWWRLVGGLDPARSSTPRPCRPR